MSRKIYEETAATAPAGVGKIVSKTGSKFNLVLADGKQLNSVGCYSGFNFEIGMCVTYNSKGSTYQILQPAPYSF